MLRNCVALFIFERSRERQFNRQVLSNDPVGDPLWHGLEDHRHLGVPSHEVSSAGVTAEEGVHAGVRDVRGVALCFG